MGCLGFLGVWGVNSEGDRGEVELVFFLKKHSKIWKIGNITLILQIVRQSEPRIEIY